MCLYVFFCYFICIWISFIYISMHWETFRTEFWTYFQKVSLYFLKLTCYFLKITCYVLEIQTLKISCLVWLRKIKYYNQKVPLTLKTTILALPWPGEFSKSESSFWANCSYYDFATLRCYAFAKLRHSAFVIFSHSSFVRIRRSSFLILDPRS